jgi:small conductance mechanosensitive channel
MRSTLRILLLLATVFSVIAVNIPVGAQESRDVGGESKNQPVTKAQGLFRSIEEKISEYQRVESDVADASGEDKEALEVRASELAGALIEDVQALAEQVAAREENGEDASADRDRVTEMLDGVSRYIRDAIGRLDVEMSELGKRREDASLEDLDGIEDRSVVLEQRLNRDLEMLLDQITVMETFGLDTASDRNFLLTRLEDRAALLAGRIELAREDLSALELRLDASPEDTALIAESERMRRQFDSQVTNLNAAVGMMESLEIDTADYRQLLFEVTGEITTDLLSGEVLGGLLSTWTGNVVDWLTDNGPRIFFKTLLFVLILLVFRLLSRVSRKVVRKAIQTSSLKVSKLLERTALSVTGAAVMIFGVLVALSQLGVEVGPLLAGLGVAGFIIGFALQDTLGNFASGVMILLYRPYDVGDLIEVAGGMGRVNNMTLVSTTILTLDHQTLVIPNSKIWGDVIKNVTAQKKRRIDMVFGISYSDDIPHAERVLKEIVEAHERVLEDPEPIVRLHNLGESSVDFVVRPWAETDDYWDVYWDVTREVKMRFDAEGISIPFPQRDVHVFEQKTADGT